MADESPAVRNAMRRFNDALLIQRQVQRIAELERHNEQMTRALEDAIGEKVQQLHQRIAELEAETLVHFNQGKAAGEISAAERSAELEGYHAACVKEIYLRGGKIKRDSKRIAELEAELSLLNRKCAWKPIEEMHEDHGPCAVINLLEDGTFMEVRWLLELEFNPDEWTHFVEIPKLSTEDAERLIEEYKRTRAAKGSDAED